MNLQHIVNVSGGKDSAACYLLAMESGRPFRAVTADTGHEAPETYDWIRALPDRTGGPLVEVVKADFTEAIERKREIVATKWRAEGLPEERIEKALEVLKPTGIPMLDMCLSKGVFASTRRRFCTQYLKAEPIFDQVYAPALRKGPVIAWHGERADESYSRSKLPRVQVVRYSQMHDKRIYRPILNWTADQVFDMHKRHRLPPNPLYLNGMSRVGCFPCVMARKSELSAIARRYPEAFERLAEWERMVSDASRRGAASFFAADKTPDGRELGSDAEQYPSALDVMAWAQAPRKKSGDGQANFLDLFDDGASCTSEYGLCE